MLRRLARDLTDAEAAKPASADLTKARASALIDSAQAREKDAVPSPLYDEADDAPF